MEQEIIEDYKRLFGDYDENSPIYAKNMNDLGEKYVGGINGIIKDYQKAFYCINISYKLGYPDAINNLGIIPLSSSLSFPHIVYVFPEPV